MISLYTSIWFFEIVWLSLRRKVKRLPLWGSVLFLLPLIIDGGTHAIRDFASIEQGFRDTDQGLVMLINNSFPVTFYASHALGLFDSPMRLFSRPLAGIAIVWFAFPYPEASFGQG